MPIPLSAECFYDQCDECRDGTCEDRCHQGQAFDPALGGWYWVDDEEWSDD